MDLYILFALGSAFFAGIVSILSKIGMKDIDSDVGTFLRTIVVLAFTWIMVAVTGQFDFSTLNWFNSLFLVLSGLATGFSWLFYFKALQLGNANKVAPIDKSSTILSILLSFLILNEAITLNNVLGLVLIAAGTFLMIERKDVQEEETHKTKRWIVYAVLSAVFAALTSILGKIGVQDVPSNLATALRTIVVLVAAFLLLLFKGKLKGVRKVTKKDVLFLVLSGIATGLSWLCYYKALKDGIANVVVSIDKLSILFTVLFAFLFLKERCSLRYLIGLALLLAGTLCMVFVPNVFQVWIWGKPEEDAVSLAFRNAGWAKTLVWKDVTRKIPFLSNSVNERI